MLELQTKKILNDIHKIIHDKNIVHTVLVSVKIFRMGIFVSLNPNLLSTGSESNDSEVVYLRQFLLCLFHHLWEGFGMFLENILIDI